MNLILEEGLDFTEDTNKLTNIPQEIIEGIVAEAQVKETKKITE